MLTQFPRSEILSPVCFTYAFNYIGGRTKVLTLSSQTKWMAQLIQFQLLWLWGLLVVLVGVNHKSHTNSNLSHISNNVFNYVVYLPSVICIINPFLQRVTPPPPHRNKHKHRERQSYTLTCAIKLPHTFISIIHIIFNIIL